jgi:hypothetical protein
MDHVDLSQQLGCLLLILVAVKVSGGLAMWRSQPAAGEQG